jgi:hypothetical protein
MSCDTAAIFGNDNAQMGTQNGNCDAERHFRNRKIHRTRIVTLKDNLFDMAMENDNFSGMTIILFVAQNQNYMKNEYIEQHKNKLQMGCNAVAVVQYTLTHKLDAE